MTISPSLAKAGSIRIQRKRTKGWKMPPNTVYVGRPTTWGNPFKVGEHGDAIECASLFRNCILGNVQPGALNKKQLAAANKAWPDCFVMPCEMTAKIFLRGKNLACWCPILDQQNNYTPCHADVLLSLANDIPIDEVIRENTRRAKGETLR